MSEPRQKKCRYIGTLNNPDTTVVEAFLEHWVTKYKATYCCGQLEKGESGTVHLQYALSFPGKGVYLSALKKVCKQSHFEPVGKDNGVDAYCMKEETRVEGPWEFGIRPVRRNSKTDWERVFEHAKKGEFHKIPAQIRVTHYGQLQRIAKDHMPPPKFRPSGEKVCIWLYGESRSGKSTLARQGDYYLKLGNKWWDGYTGQDRVVVDDLGKEAAKALTDKLKLWSDPHFDQIGETKGGAISLTYSTFVVTSNYHPSDIWDGEADLDPLMLRFTVTDKMMRDPNYEKDDKEKIDPILFLSEQNRGFGQV